MSQNGKGSRQRARTVDQKTWDRNWDRIFKSKPKDKSNVKRRKSLNQN
jgi:hypothetical protein